MNQSFVHCQLYSFKDYLCKEVRQVDMSKKKTLR